MTSLCANTLPANWTAASTATPVHYTVDAATISNMGTVIGTACPTFGSLTTISATPLVPTLPLDTSFQSYTFMQQVPPLLPPVQASAKITGDGLEAMIRLLGPNLDEGAVKRAIEILSQQLPQEQKCGNAPNSAPLPTAPQTSKKAPLPARALSRRKQQVGLFCPYGE